MADRFGYIYLLAGGGYYKIGRTRHVPSRINALGIQLPFKVDLVHYFAMTDMIVGETFLHEMFADRRVNGEWFALTPKDVAWFCKYLRTEGCEVPSGTDGA